MLIPHHYTLADAVPGYDRFGGQFVVFDKHGRKSQFYSSQHAVAHAAWARNRGKLDACVLIVTEPKDVA